MIQPDLFNQPAGVIQFEPAPPEPAAAIMQTPEPDKTEIYIFEAAAKLTELSKTIKNNVTGNP